MFLENEHDCNLPTIWLIFIVFHYKKINQFIQFSVIVQ